MKLVFAFLLCVPLSLTAGVVVTGGCDTVAPGYGTGVDGTVLTAVAEYDDPVFSPSTCVVTVSADYATAAPEQPGFIQYSLFGSTEYSDDSFGASATFSIDGTEYGSCNEFACLPATGTIPIELGTDFTVTLTASGFENGDSFGAALIQATINEASASDPNEPLDISFAALAPAPEPGTLVLMTISFLCLGAFLTKGTWYRHCTSRSERWTSSGE